MVRRAAQVEALAGALQEARNGAGQTIFVAGEAGIGKSRLIRETTRVAGEQGFLVLQGQCFEPDRSLPYAPLLDLLRPLTSTGALEELVAGLGTAAHDLASLLPEVSRCLVDPIRPAMLGPEHQKRRLFQALADVVAYLAARQPLLVVIEDAHWSDDTSLELVDYLARDIRAQPVLLLLTYRSDEAHTALAHALVALERRRLSSELRLERLSVAEVEAMLRALLGRQRAVSAELLRVVYSLTEGNPFFVEELVQSLQAEGEVVVADGVGVRTRPALLRAPRSVRDAVAERSARLSAEARRVLELAAIAGRRFDFELLQVLLGIEESELLELMKELIAAYLVVEESADRFAFRHALTRQAIYDRMLARERRALHRQVAAALENLFGSGADARVEDLAYHWIEAGDWNHGLSYAQRAAERASALHAPRATIEQATRALDAAGHLGTPPSPRLFRLRGQAHELVGDLTAARSDYESALERACEAGDQRSEWQALLDLGLFWTGHDYARAGPFFEHALELARQRGDSAALGHSLNRLGNWHLNVEQPREAARHHDQALAIFEELNDRHGIAETLDLLAMADVLGADAIRCADYAERAASLFRELDDRQGLASSTAVLATARGAHQFDTGAPSDVTAAVGIAHGELALKITREIGWRAGEAFALLSLGSVLGWQGEYGRAYACADAALAIAEEIEHLQWRTYAYRLLGELHLDLLAPGPARQRAEQAVALAREVGSQHWLHEASALAASAAILQGELGAARWLLDAASIAEGAMLTMGQRHCWCARAELALADDEPARALQIVERLIASASGAVGAPAIPRLSLLRARALAALGRPAEAERVLAEAETVAAGLGARPLLWRIRVDRCRLLVHGRTGRGEAELLALAAREVVEELAATVPDQDLREHFLRRATGRLPPRRPPTTLQSAKRAFGGLTARERQVTGLIAAGGSNRSIADELVLSERTVEKHVAGILAKLGLGSRAQIAAWAVRVGLAPDEQ